MDKRSVPTREILKQSADVLPRTGGNHEVIPEQVASAYMLDLERSGSEIPQHIRSHLSTIVTAIEADLEPVPGTEQTFVITENELRGALARAMIKGAAIAGLDITAAQQSVDALEQSILGTDHGTAA